MARISAREPSRPFRRSAAPLPPRRRRLRKHVVGDLTLQHGGGRRLGPRVEAAAAAGGPCPKQLLPPPSLLSCLLGQRPGPGEGSGDPGRRSWSAPAPRRFLVGEGAETLPKHRPQWFRRRVSVRECVTRAAVCAAPGPERAGSCTAPRTEPGPVPQGPSERSWGGLPGCVREAQGLGPRPVPHANPAPSLA